MVRRITVAALAFVLFACSPNDSCPKVTCKAGVSFLFKDIAGGLAAGGKVPLKVCVDGTCKDLTVTRADADSRQFIEVGGLGGDGDHTITVAATGGRALKGEYKGKLATVAGQPDGAACPGACAIATVRVGEDGTITPGVPTPTAASTTVAGAAPTTTAGG